MKEYKPHASSIGDVAANLVAAACYVSLLLSWSFSMVVLLAVFFLEKKSGLVKFSAMQGMGLWLVRLVAGGGIAYESFFAVVTRDPVYMQGLYGWESGAAVIVIRLLIDALFIALELFALVYACRWRVWRVPLIGMAAGWVCAHTAKPAYHGDGAVPWECAPGFDGSVQAQQAKESAGRGNGTENVTAMIYERVLRTSEVPLAERAEPPPGSRDNDEPAMERAVRYNYELPKADPNTHLPADMRDPPREDEQRLNRVKNHFGFARPAGALDEPLQEVPNTAAAIKTRRRAKKQNGAVQGQPAALAQASVQARGKSAKGWFFWPKGSPAYEDAAGLAPDDPNRSLPIEMRDPPPPVM